MSDEIVRIKGTKSGLQLLFAAGATYAAIEKEIRAKLRAGSGFFCRGTVMHAMEGSLSKDEMEKLKRLFHEQERRSVRRKQQYRRRRLCLQKTRRQSPQLCRRHQRTTKPCRWSS